MPVPRIYHTEAIVLSRFELGEADRVLTLLTPHDGKLKAIAKGVRRPRSRLGGAVEPFAELHLVLARARTFDVITSASVGPRLAVAARELESTATAWYLAELAERAVEERAFAYPVYALLKRAYQLLDDGMAPGARGALVRVRPGRRPGHAPGGRALRRVRPRARSGRGVPLGTGPGRDAVLQPPEPAG